MLNPVLETLFFLKIARNSVCESIMGSDVEDKVELVNYVQNEASDYEIMHLTVLGEMPEEKYNAVAEQAVWEIFQEAVVLNSATLQEDMLAEDIMTIVYEMGPVSHLGCSSAQPILEFQKANGMLKQIIEGETAYMGNKKRKEAAEDYASDFSGPTRKEKIVQGAKNIAHKTGQKVDAAKTGFIKRYTKTTRPDPAPGAPEVQSVNKGQVAKDLGAGALGVAGIYGLYKLIKYWKNKKKEGVKGADAQLAKAQQKLKDKKAKA